MIAVREGYSSYFDRNPINPPPLISFPSPPGEPLHEGDAEARRTPLLREYALTTLESILLSLDGRTVVRLQDHQRDGQGVPRLRQLSMVQFVALLDKACLDETAQYRTIRSSSYLHQFVNLRLSRSCYLFIYFLFGDR